jgi:hypothetical protein
LGIEVLKVYLDIDGVILANEKNASKHVHEFLEYITTNFDVYWLTSHCQGDAEHTVNHLARVLPEDTIKLLRDVKPTRWDNNKTDAIDFSQPFLWFDDELYPEEKERLEREDKLSSQRLINLSIDEEQLIKELKMLKDIPI